MKTYIPFYVADAILGSQSRMWHSSRRQACAARYLPAWREESAGKVKCLQTGKEGHWQVVSLFSH